MSKRNSLQEITTKAYRCGEAAPTCPGVLKLEDGKYAGRYVARGFVVWPTGIVQAVEYMVLIDPEMIAAAVEADKQRA